MPNADASLPNTSGLFEAGNLPEASNLTEAGNLLEAGNLPEASSLPGPGGIKGQREGFTTGTAAAAVCAAAVHSLLGKRHPAVISVALPPNFTASLNIPVAFINTAGFKDIGHSGASGNRQAIAHASGQAATPAFAPATFPATASNIKPVIDSATGPDFAPKLAPASAISALAVVIKDGGDDPDATHKLRLEAIALPEDAALEDLAPEYAAAFKRPAEVNAPPLVLAPGLTLYPGPGIGLVTLPGLPVPPGEAAINPQPRRQILKALQSALADYPPHGPLKIYLRAPEGHKKAALTLNSRLGIQGGISILGTSGIVKPYSHSAWQAVIAQSAEQAVTLGISSLAFSTGRRSELALQREFPALPPQAFIQAADYAAFAVREACRPGVEHIIWGCFSGKLLKLAQGLEWTHANSAETDLDLLRGITARKAPQTAQALARNEAWLKCPTAQGLFDLLEAENPPACMLVAQETATLALESLFKWVKKAAPRKTPRIELLLFRPDNSLWLRLETPGKHHGSAHA